MPTPSAHSPYSREKRQRYGRDWEQARQYHLASHPLCVICEQQGRVEAATVVDHIVPVQTDPSKRLDPDNFRSLCKSHHDRSAQVKDTLGFMPDVGIDGLPVDQGHPFYAGWDK